ncbi:hypothetical protein ACLKA7_007877 [Drosophila subpalustris]
MGENVDLSSIGRGLKDSRMEKYNPEGGKQRRKEVQAELREIEFTNNMDEDYTLDDSSVYDTNTDNKEPHVEAFLPEIYEKIAKENFRKVSSHQDA